MSAHQEVAVLGTDQWVEKIGEQVQALRVQRELQQVELAQMANVSRGALQNLEQGKGATLTTLIKVVRALGEERWLGDLDRPVTISPRQLRLGRTIHLQTVKRVRRGKRES